MTLLSAVLPDFAARNQLAPNLVATANDLRVLTRAFVAGNLPGAKCGLLRGWRSGAILPHFLALLEGRRSIRLADLGREAPLEYEEFP